VQELLRWPYRMVVQADLEGGFRAEAPDLPNCVTGGETPEEATAMLRDAMYGWLLVAVEEGQSIPEPAPDLDRYSGKFNLRVPKHLHRDLVGLAERDGVSLNTLVVGLLERGVGGVTAASQSNTR
jgi:antitoxin HicB